MEPFDQLVCAVARFLEEVRRGCLDLPFAAWACVPQLAFCHLCISVRVSSYFLHRHLPIVRINKRSKPNGPTHENTAELRASRAICSFRAWAAVVERIWPHVAGRKISVIFLTSRGKTLAHVQKELRWSPRGSFWLSRFLSCAAAYMTVESVASSCFLMPARDPNPNLNWAVRLFCEPNSCSVRLYVCLVRSFPLKAKSSLEIYSASGRTRPPGL